MRRAGILAGECGGKIGGAVLAGGGPAGAGRGLHTAAGLSDRGGKGAVHYGV